MAAFQRPTLQPSSRRAAIPHFCRLARAVVVRKKRNAQRFVVRLVRDPQAFFLYWAKLENQRLDERTCRIGTARFRDETGFSLDAIARRW